MNSYSYGSFSNDQTATAIIGGMLIFTVIAIIVGLIMYVISAIALTRMATKGNIPNPWLAWIPLGNTYIMGTLVGEMDFLGKRLTNLGVMAIVIPFGAGIAASILQIIPILGTLASIAIYVLLLIFMVKLFYNLYERFVPESATLFTVLSLVIPITMPFLLLSASSHEYRGPVTLGYPQQPQPMQPGVNNTNTTFCANCGQSLSSQTTFCPKCGNKA